MHNIGTALFFIAITITCAREWLHTQHRPVTCSHESSLFILCFTKIKMIQKLTFNITGYLGTFKWVKWLRHEIDHSPPSNATDMNEQSYTSTPIKQKYFLNFNNTAINY